MRYRSRFTYELAKISTRLWGELFIRPYSRFRVLNLADYLLLATLSYLIATQLNERFSLIRYTEYAQIAAAVLAGFVVAAMHYLSRRRWCALFLLAALPLVWGGLFYQGVSYLISLIEQPGSGLRGQSHQIDPKIVFSLALGFVVLTHKVRMYWSTRPLRPSGAKRPGSVFQRILHFLRHRQAGSSANRASSSNTNYNGAGGRKAQGTNQKKSKSKSSARGTAASTPRGPTAQERAATLLGCQRTDSQPVIKKAYYEQIKKYHPDKVSHLGKEFQQVAHDKMIALQAAYSLLKR